MRDLLLKDFGWKMLSLSLAIAIWLTVKTVSTERGDQVERPYVNLPVQIVSSSTDARAFKVSPEVVAVTVKGRGDVMKALTEQEIRVFADTTSADTSAPRRLTRRIQVAVPVGISIVRIEPTEVIVEIPGQVQTAPKFPVNNP
jgi:YbbR domain-containing protein